MDQPIPFSTRVEFLHAVAGTRSTATRDLHRLAAAQHQRRNSRRRSVRYSFDLYIMDTEFHLRGVWKHSLDCWRILRIEARGYRDRFGRGYSNRKESAQESGDVDPR